MRSRRQVSARTLSERLYGATAVGIERSGEDFTYATAETVIASAET
ncbi:hypothetical protein [Streptomyces boluensis]|nr:hypothetical protein [Streptomyces boluensis]